jgi:CHAD domain-containing protein
MRHLQVPSHLLDCDWAAYELSVLANLTRDLQVVTAKLEKKLTTNRVHNARIALRRFQSICRILDRDGLRLDEYDLAKRELNSFRKNLGKLRDLEILVELAQAFDLDQSILRSWQSKCEDRNRKTMKQINAKKMQQLLKSLGRAIRHVKRPYARFSQVHADDRSGAAHHNNGGSKIECAYDHLEPYLVQLEDLTRETEMKAFSPVQLHELRIEIKSWRYFLTEFFGLTNLQIVKAQQLLGKVHDIDRMLEILADSNKLPTLSSDKLARISAFRGKLLGEFGKFRKHLPYGLRPSVTSRAGVPEPGTPRGV